MSSERPVSFAIGPDPRRARDAGGKPDDGRRNRDEAGEEDHDEAGAGAAAVGGFFRERGRPAVAYQFEETRHCTVQSPSQMSAYGGFEQVRMVRRLAMRGEDAGPCAWPNGFYRRSNEPVYRLHGRGALNLGRRACHVVNPRQMELFGGFGQLRVVEPSSELFQDREQPGECEDPRGSR
jgi:hypothetical protein